MLRLPLRRPPIRLCSPPPRSIQFQIRYAHAEPGDPAYKPLPGASVELIKYRATLVGIWFAMVGLGAVTYFFLPDRSKAAPDRRDVLLSPRRFAPATLTYIKECPDPDTRLITLTLPPQAVPNGDDSIYNPIWSVYIKDDDIQVERPYTPLEGVDERGRMKFWIKKYDKGEVGRWLHSKKMGNRIELRGPLSTWLWDDNKWDEVVMISGGTGITPFYQLLHAKLLKDPSKVPTKTRFTLLHASRKPVELPPPDILDPLLSASKAHPDRLRLSLFVDSSEGPTHPSVGSNDVQVGRINDLAIARAVGSDNSSWWRSLLGIGSRPDSRDLSDKKILFLLCGPEPMITAIAGPYGRNFSQGAVGGVLGELGYKGHQVWKM
ncbi:ferredoxin reductase-like C-terminal NADP-linked domain-containing protein [Rhodofomes roseus]|uniref:Ferredoxin reductase-like C-terminal NADP-linked domain-containing protein n=1 Tax=Rhodofomes roseus TaxID=34475 RepID=A0ABQ8KY16_9APHY|nr:ferredoxin reductase-like C-terminal NADP-linked domain-containing protein [Rhodofomes roseus]KAH9844199.1 ferredoxin reductase-like C-terminal NADP-linked domain-containing protein [Rhodofomes roseus]